MAQGKKWFSTVALTFATVYGPFLLIGMWALFTVDCSHCRNAFWQLAPVAPGFLLGELVSRVLHLPRMDDSGSFALGAVITVAHLVIIGWIIHQRRFHRWLLPPALLLYSALAFLTLAVVRA